MKRFFILALPLAAITVLSYAFAFAGQTTAKTQARSSCGCVDCQCPDCNGEFCTCTVCNCGSCGCQQSTAAVVPVKATKSCCAGTTAKTAALCDCPNCSGESCTCEFCACEACTCGV